MQSRTANSCQQFAPSSSAFHNWVSNVALFIIIPSLVIFHPPWRKLRCVHPCCPTIWSQNTIRAKTSVKSSAACKTRTGCQKLWGGIWVGWICIAAIQLSMICQDSHPSCGAPQAIYSMPHYNKWHHWNHWNGKREMGLQIVLVLSPL